MSNNENTKYLNERYISNLDGLRNNVLLQMIVLFEVVL